MNPLFRRKHVFLARFRLERIIPGIEIADDIGAEMAGRVGIGGQWRWSVASRYLLRQT